MSDGVEFVPASVASDLSVELLERVARMTAAVLTSVPEHLHGAAAVDWLDAEYTRALEVLLDEFAERLRAYIVQAPAQ